MEEVISGSQVNLQRLRKLLHDAYISFEDFEGGLRVQENGVIVLVQIDSDKDLVGLSSLWSFEPHVSRSRRLEIVNSLNDGVILVRFSVTSEGNMWCDVQIPYKEGILARGFIDTLKRFVIVARGAVARNGDEFK